MARVHEYGLAVLTDAGEAGLWVTRTTPIITETGRVVAVVADVLPSPEVEHVSQRTVRNIRIPQMSRGEH